MPVPVHFGMGSIKMDIEKYGDSINPASSIAFDRGPDAGKLHLTYAQAIAAGQIQIYRDYKVKPQDIVRATTKQGGITYGKQYDGSNGAIPDFIRTYKEAQR